MNNNLLSLIQLTESDKRLIAAILLLLILIFIIVGYIVVLIEKIMKYQGDYIDKVMHDMVITGVIDNSKQFRKIAFYKSRQRLFLKARIPALILLFCGAVTLASVLIYNANGWKLDFFEFNNGTTNVGGSGFNTILFLWNFNAPMSERVPHTFNFFGHVITDMQPPLINTPHLSVMAIPSYIIVISFLVGAIWFLVEVQAYISRTIRIFKLSKSVYSKSLKDFNASKNAFEPTSNASEESK